jgi:hypothetical protein
VTCSRSASTTDAAPCCSVTWHAPANGSESATSSVRNLTTCQVRAGGPKRIRAEPRCAGTRVRCARDFEKRNDQLTREEIGGPYRFFHIDGGHLTQEALTDLHLAADVLHDAGVIVLDDPFRCEWPGVTEAFLQFLDHRHDFVPVALGFNKLVICKRDARRTYDEALAAPWDRFTRRVWDGKELLLAGSPVRVFVIPMHRKIVGLDQRISWALWLQSALRLRLRRALRGG